MRRALSLFVLTPTAISVSIAQKPNGLTHTPPRLYELYSWRQSDGIWSFSILPSPSGVNTTADPVFNKNFVPNGVDKLKRKISELPAGTKRLWLDRIGQVRVPKDLEARLYLHPDYEISRPSGCTICVRGWARFTPYADPCRCEAHHATDLSWLTISSPECFPIAILKRPKTGGRQARLLIRNLRMLCGCEGGSRAKSGCFRHGTEPRRLQGDEAW